MNANSTRARLTGRASYWVARLELALAAGDLATAAFAQGRLRALGWSVRPRAPWSGTGPDPDDAAQDLAAELDHEAEKAVRS
jgi:hypothetical protein